MEEHAQSEGGVGGIQEVSQGPGIPAPPPVLYQSLGLNLNLCTQLTTYTDL